MKRVASLFADGNGNKGLYKGFYKGVHLNDYFKIALMEFPKIEKWCWKIMWTVGFHCYTAETDAWISYSE